MKKIKTFYGPEPYVSDGDFLNIKIIREECKKAKVNFNTAEIRTTIDYSGCYYESDQPSIKIELWAEKKK